MKATKKVQTESDSLNVERILLSLHRYLVQYSENMALFSNSQGSKDEEYKMVNSNSSETKEGNKNGFLAAKSLVYEL